MSTQQEAEEELMRAVKAYTALLPPVAEPTTPPDIRPKVMHARPDCFHRGLNMILDAGGFMPGKIPVLVLPLRDEDIRRYKRSTIKKLLYKYLP